MDLNALMQISYLSFLLYTILIFLGAMLIGFFFSVVVGFNKDKPLVKENLEIQRKYIDFLDFAKEMIGADFKKKEMVDFSDLDREADKFYKKNNQKKD